MADGFYYNIYGPILIGGGPPRSYYSVEDQITDALLDDLAVKAGNKAIEASYQRLGMWFPQELQPNPAENGSGTLVNAYA